MIAGHTKFAPDRLFSFIGSAYKAADIFTVDELQSLCAQSAQTVVIEKGENTLAWRETISTKYLHKVLEAQVLFQTLQAPVQVQFRLIHCNINFYNSKKKEK